MNPPKLVELRNYGRDYYMIQSDKCMLESL